MADYFSAPIATVYTFDPNTGILTPELMRVPGASKPSSPNQVHTPGSGAQDLPILGKDTQGLVEEVVIGRGHAVYFLRKPLLTEPLDAEKNDCALRRAKKEVRTMERMARELDAVLVQDDSAPEADSDDESDDESDIDDSSSSDGSAASDDEEDMEDVSILPTSLSTHSSSHSSSSSLSSYVSSSISAKSLFSSASTHQPPSSQSFAQYEELAAQLIAEVEEQVVTSSHPSVHSSPPTANIISSTPVQPVTAATSETEDEWEEIIFGSAGVADEADASSEDERPLSEVVRAARASREASRISKSTAASKVKASLALPVKTATQSGIAAKESKSSSSVVKPSPAVGPCSTPPIIAARNFILKTATQSGIAAQKSKSSSPAVKPPPAVTPCSTPPTIAARNFILKSPPTPKPKARSSPKPDRNFFSKRKIPSRPVPQPPVSRPVPPTPSTAPTVGQKRKRDVDDDTEEGEISDSDNNQPQPRPRGSSRPAKKPKVFFPFIPKRHIAVPCAPAPVTQTQSSSSSAPTTTTTEPPKAPAKIFAPLRWATDEAHRLWKGRMQQKGSSDRPRTIRVVSTDLVAMGAKVPRPRAAQGRR